MKIKWRERFEEVKPLPAQDKYVGVYLLGLVKGGETFNVINMSWFAIKTYHKFCGRNICNSFFWLRIYEGLKRTLQCILNKISFRFFLSSEAFSNNRERFEEGKTFPAQSKYLGGYLRDLFIMKDLVIQFKICLESWEKKMNHFMIIFY